MHGIQEPTIEEEPYPVVTFWRIYAREGGFAGFQFCLWSDGLSVEAAEPFAVGDSIEAVRAALPVGLLPLELLAIEGAELKESWI